VRVDSLRVGCLSKKKQRNENKEKKMAILTKKWIYRPASCFLVVQERKETRSSEVL